MKEINQNFYKNKSLYNNKISNNNIINNKITKLVNSKNLLHFKKNIFTNNIKDLQYNIKEFFSLINNNNLSENNDIIIYYIKKRKASTIQIENLIKDLNSANFSINKLKNKYVIKYNNFDYEFNFQKVIDIKDKNIKYLLLLFVNIVRLYYVDELLNIITRNLSCSEIKNIYKYCNVVEVGSTNLTSNYDITVNGIIYPQYIVQLFNFTFYSFWNDYSSNVFDTNIYGSTFFISIPYKYFPNNYPRDLYLLIESEKYKKNILYLNPSNDIQNIIFINQLKWLLLKIECHKIEYNIDELYVNNIILLLKNIINKNASSNLSLNNLTKEKSVLQPNQLYNHNRNNNNSNINEKLSLKIAKYEECQIEIKNKEFNYENSKTNQSLIELIEVISKSNYYGMETYYCIGTIYHVLGYIQGLCEFEMNNYYYIESIIENYIDMFRYYELIDYNIDYAIIKMSKYAYRLYNALNMITSNKYSEKEDLFKDIINKLKKYGSFNSNNTLKTKLINLFELNNNNIFNTFITNINNDISENM